MEGLLRDGGRCVVFGVIQKYGAGFTFAGEAEGSGDDRDLTGEGTGRSEDESPGPVPDFPECDTSPDILLLADEAHRSHTSVLHVALRKAIPNAARIGFTGTPITTGREEDTRRIFGRGDSPRGFLDEYRTEDADHDGVVVRIRYEGRTGEGGVRDGEVLWYRRAGRNRTGQRLRPWAARMGVTEPEPDVRDLGDRWGSYRPPRAGAGAKGLLTLGWPLFQLPVHLIDYVIARELAHVKVYGQREDLWRLLRTALPGYEGRRVDPDELGRRLWMGDVR